MNAVSKKLIAGNWKMNGSIESARDLMAGIMAEAQVDGVDFLVCPSFLHVPYVLDCVGAGVSVGAQDCSDQAKGAYTGQVSAAMLKDVGCSYVILGHSERRQYQGECNTLIAAKASRAMESGLVSIICVGESEEDREAGREKDVVLSQLKGSIPKGANAANVVIAYEPVWAIGTGKTASPSDVSDMHSYIRQALDGVIDGFNDVRILYGGSMKPENAKALLSIQNVDGGLIGGASLTVEQFINIGKAAF